jgi:hypothetical protein
MLFLRGARLSLTTHARVLLRTVHHLRGLRLREIAATVASRSAALIASPPTWPKLATFPNHEDDRTNRHQIQAYRPLPGPTSQELGDLLDFFAGTGADAARQGSSAQARPRQ